MVAPGCTGVVTLIHHHGSAAKINVHLLMLVIDGATNPWASGALPFGARAA